MISVKYVIAETAAQFGLTPDDIKSRRREKKYVRPRQVGMYLARQLTDQGLNQIGRAFGDRDHTTVLHAIAKIDRLRKTDLAIEAFIARFEGLTDRRPEAWRILTKAQRTQFIELIERLIDAALIDPEGVSRRLDQLLQQTPEGSSHAS